MKNTFYFFNRRGQPVADTWRGFAKLLAPAIILTSACAALANPHDGIGTMTVSPDATIANSTGNSFVFSFRESPVNGKRNYPHFSTVTIAVPSGWTAPQTTNSASPGFVSAAAAGEALPEGVTLDSTAVNGTGPWTITVIFSGGDSTNDGFDLTYAGGGTGVTAPSITGVSTFTAQSKGGNGGELVDLAVSPAITTSATFPINNQIPANITGLMTLGNGLVQISFVGAQNTPYVIQATTDLTPPIVWTNISTNTSDENGFFQFTDTTSAGLPMRFYRTTTVP